MFSFGCFLGGLLLGFYLEGVNRRRKLLAQVKHAEEIAQAPAITLKEGWSHNPMMSYPVNHPCFCGSGAKFKLCCKKGLTPYIKTDKVAFVKKEMADILKLVEEANAK